MSSYKNGQHFSQLFKKYRLRSEISSLSEFGDLLAEEGIIYENSLFTRWQNGERVPKDRRNLLSIVKVFCKCGGMTGINEANKLFESSGQGYLTKKEEQDLYPFLINPPQKTVDTLGSLIREYRIRKNFSQKELSLALGWKEEESVNEIEENFSEKPQRELIDKISNILDITEQEKNNLLLVGNFIPTNEEVNKVLEYVLPIINNWPYPAVVLDFTWRMVAENQKSKRVFYKFENSQVPKFDTLRNIIEIIFDPNYVMNQQTGEVLYKWREWQYEIVVQFIGEQKLRTKEKWYCDLIQKMLNNQEFKDIWNSAQKRNIKLYISHYGNKVLPNPVEKEKNLAFNFFVVPIFGDARFEIEFYNPADLETFSFYYDKR